jgi:hypothetical protein
MTAHEADQRAEHVVELLAQLRVDLRQIAERSCDLEAP